MGTRAPSATVGDQVAFAAGRYRPDTPSAARLLAHELTHVVQQRRGLEREGGWEMGSGRGTPATTVHELKIGDILQIAFPGKSNIGHSMVMTGIRDEDYLFSYHSTDTLDAPFWAPGGILSRNPGAKFYGWKL